MRADIMGPAIKDKGMKNQYVADIGDYGKYSLLRFFAQHGIRIGVNWYLTCNDDSAYGKFTDYLKQAEKFSRYDPTVFEQLAPIANNM